MSTDASPFVPYSGFLRTLFLVSPPPLVAEGVKEVAKASQARARIVHIIVNCILLALGEVIAEYTVRWKYISCSGGSSSEKVVLVTVVSVDSFLDFDLNVADIYSK